MKSDMEEIGYIVDRVHHTRNLPTPTQYVRQRMAAAAEQLNRATALAEHTETANEALYKLVTLLYYTVNDKLINLDRQVGRILVPTPWGSRGWKKWGLRHWEAQTLSKLLQARARNQKHTPLFEYDQDTTCWYVRLDAYPTLAHAQDYLQHNQISAREWRHFSDKQRRNR